MDEVILARHGESELSVAGIVNGDPAVACALTETGVEQARRLAERLADVEIDLCVTSEFERTRETADLALAGRDVARLVLTGLNDIRFGAFEGGPLSAYRAWARAHGPTDRPPGRATANGCRSRRSSGPAKYQHDGTALRARTSAMAPRSARARGLAGEHCAEPILAFQRRLQKAQQLPARDCAPFNGHSRIL